MSTELEYVCRTDDGRHMAAREFRDGSGRDWRVCHINLENWPNDWADYPDEELVNLLRRAAPRPESEVHDPDAPQRRWDDAAPP
jgi:hypothetical protein